MRDQSPAGEAGKYLRAELPELVADPRVVLTAGDNLLHSGGHNALIRAMTGELYLCASVDMRYDARLLTELVAALRARPDFAVACPKLLQWDLAHNRRTQRLDSCGIVAQSCHHFADCGQGERDAGQHDEREWIWGASGALFLARRSALDAVAAGSPPQYFDELLHYKNDVDLAYRLNWAGQKTLFVPTALAWHDRQLAARSGGVLRNRNHKSRWERENSWFGQIVVLRKNLHGLGWRTRWATHWYLARAAVFAAVFEPWLLRQWWRARRVVVIPTQRRVPAIVIEELLRGNTLKTDKYQSVAQTRGSKHTATAIILNYHKAARVVDAVAALRAQRIDFVLDIVVADNSCDIEQTRLLRAIPAGDDLRVIINDTNLGYTRGYNRAAADAHGDTIFIINPDIICQQRDALQRLWRHLRDCPQTGIVAPHQQNPDGSTEFTARHFPQLLQQIIRRTPLRRVFKKYIEAYELRNFDTTQQQLVDWLQSSFWAVRADFWRASGGFDERYQIFLADVALCRRAWRSGGQVVYLPTVTVQADGRRASSGGLLDIFRSRVLRVHLRDALVYWWREGS